MWNKEIYSVAFQKLLMHKEREWSVHTPCFSASGAVHLIGSFPPSNVKFSSLAKPKSDTLATPSSDIRTFRAARSRWTTFRDSKYSIPEHVSLQ